MEKFSDINLIETLRAVMEINTTCFKNNFKIDTEILRHFAQSGEPGNKIALWVSYPDGTFCDTEMQVFLKGTYANSAWLRHSEQTNGRALAYALEINGINTDDGAVYGNLYSLDYKAHAEHVRDAAQRHAIFTRNTRNPAIRNNSERRMKRNCFCMKQLNALLMLRK